MSGASELPRSGTAREVPRGRLAGFEDDPAPTFALPPRPARSRAPVETAEEPTTEAPEKSVAFASEAEPASPEAVDAAASHGGGAEASGPVRASNVHIPVELIEAFNTAKTEQKLSNGELIITAIEATYADLQRQLRPPSPTGGSLFVQRVTRPPRLPAAGPVTPVNYRLRPDDYATLDRLVRDLGASSRSHLITEALRGYLNRTA